MRQSAETELITQKTLQGKICVVGIKKGGGEGREKSAKGKKEGSAVSSLSPQSPSLFLFLPIPYPFRRLLRWPQHIYTESGTFADSGRMEQILPETGSSYKLPTPGPPHRAKEN